MSVEAGNYLAPIKWGTSTNGAVGFAETDATLGTPREDTRIPPNNYNISGLQLARCRQLAGLMSATFQGGTRLQVLGSATLPFNLNEVGIESRSTRPGFFLGKFSWGPFSYETATGGGSYRVLQASTFVNATPGDQWQLPPALLMAGYQIKIADTQGGAAGGHIVIIPYSGEHINGGASVIISSNFGSYTCISSGSGWTAFLTV